MSFPALSAQKVAELREDGLSDEQIEKMDKREMKKLDEKLKMMTLNVLGPQRDANGQELRLVLLGKTGAGKSATGNLLLGREEFVESSRAVSCTATIQEGRADVDGMHVRVIDTPGFYDTDRKPAEIVAEVVMDTFSDGIHGFLFVFNAETYRFTEEQRKIFSMFEQGLFGPTFVNCCYIVITHGNGITKSLADYVRDQAGTPLGQIMNSTLRGRIIAVENSCEGSYFRQGQQKQVLRFIASSTGDAMYTNEDMQQHRRDTLESVDVSVRSMVPMIETEVFKSLQRMTQAEIKNLSESTKLRITGEILDTVMQEMEMATIPQDKIHKAVVKVLERKRDLLSGTDFLDKIKAFVLPLLAVAGQVLPDIVKLVMQLRKK